MPNVVGLVRSRLRSGSRRGQSVDGIDVVVSEGGHLVRQQSLRQQALAEPTGDDIAIHAVQTNMSARTPTELDPYILANSLQTSGPLPPLPPAPSLPESAFPARHSSLHSSRAYQVRAHRKAASQDQGVDSIAPQEFHRRHYTISSPDMPDEYNVASDYFGQDPNKTAPTRTAKLFGTISKNQNRKSLNLQDDRQPPLSVRRSRDMSRSEHTTQRDEPAPHRSGSGGIDDLSGLEQALPDIEPTSPINLDAQTSQPEISEHVRLPPGFKPGHTEHTTVEEVWHPAVENQTIEHRKIVVTQPEIERDVHIHHYFEYEQPVYTTEILPPKHYRLDEKTGKKIEIQAPAYWKMPTSLTPRKADLSGLMGTQRHYLVDETHPFGVLESPPATGVTTWI
jgi:hypothetical protein